MRIIFLILVVSKTRDILISDFDRYLFYIQGQILHSIYFKTNMNSQARTYCSVSEFYDPSFQMISTKHRSKKVAAVIVTFVGGQSYDSLFREREQKSERGTQVSVYQCKTTSLAELLIAFQQNRSQNPIVREMMEDIEKVDGNCVVFNWQCCSFYTEEYFYEGAEIVMKFLKLVIDRGFMVMFSDFSLKALIKNWDEKYLGPLPFAKLGEISGRVELVFDCNKLKNSPSSQLKAVGEIAVHGSCQLRTLSETIVYGCPKQVHTNQVYELEVLSTMKQKSHKMPIKSDVQVLGHALLKYKSGGCLLASMGHWIQLMKIETTEQTLFEMAELSYGITQSKIMKNVYMSLQSQQERRAYLTKTSVKMISQRSPCMTMTHCARLQKN